MLRKLSLYFLAAILCGSCAIHKDFPYICFLPGCIAKQFGLPSMKEVKAKSKSRRKTRQAKRLRSKGKRDNAKDKFSHPPRYEESEDPDEPVVTKKDSLKYSFRSDAEDNYIVIRFARKDKDRTDSILVKYPEKGDEISVYEKQLLKMYVDSSKVENIEWIRIIEHSGSRSEDEHLEKHPTVVKRNLSEFFIGLGIPPERIRLRK